MSNSNHFAGAFSGVAVLLVCLPCVVAAAAEPTAEKAHPLDAVIRWAQETFKQAEKIEDYTATLTKRERVGDRLQDYQYLQLKIRNEPFSVYLKFLKPSYLAGRELIYVEGRNDGMLLAHDPHGVGEIIGTVSLAPDGLIAMRGQRYPVTMIGFKHLASKLIERAKRDRQVDGPCDVKWFKGAKVDGRSTWCVQVSHPVRNPQHQFAMARVYVDDELHLPIRYEGYAWPEKPGEGCVLVEEYTYSCIRLNVGLTDEDFDPKNPQYNFDR